MYTALESSSEVVVVKVMLSSLGSRGDVQPLLALALELRARGHVPTVCVPPNFRDWVEGYGLAFVPIGPDVRQFVAARKRTDMPSFSPEQLRELAIQSVRSQFRELGAVVDGHDVVVATTTLQFAARSLAEARHIPYVFAAYCPTVFPSPHHPPPVMAMAHSLSLSADENRRLWDSDAASFDARFLDTINDERSQLGLPVIDHVRAHIFGVRPMLAADAGLAPAAAGDVDVVQTGAWLLADPTPLPDAVEAFLAAGPPPIYFGFGSMATRIDLVPLLVDAARACGRRALVSRGWANLALDDDRGDCLLVDDLSHAQLFPRVAAVVHHGGAGTTHAVARAGVPQVVVPHTYDQFYFAHRVCQLGVGVELRGLDQLDVTRVGDALRSVLADAVVAKAHTLASTIDRSGASRAADHVAALATHRA